jgi:hypothetical protein
MNGYGSYTEYVALVAHFKSEKYNYFKHKGSKITENSLKKHNDRYWFCKLESHYGTEENMLNFYLAQMTTHSHEYYWVGDSFSDRCQENYTNYTKRNAQLTRFVNQEIRYLYDSYPIDLIYKVDTGYPKIISAYLGGKIGLETLIILDDINQWISKSDALTGIVGTPLLMKLKKYKPFMNYNIKTFRKTYDALNLQKDF